VQTTSNYWGTAAMNLFDLTGRVAIITGGNAGIGFGIAKGLAAAGAAIVIAGRRAEKNLEAARAIEVFNVKTAALEVDVCQQESCRAMVGNTVERFGCRYPRQQCRNRHPQTA
jgi:2-dehydro-3-deoxy-D-gluconate 5-dehydrogenase